MMSTETFLPFPSPEVNSKVWNISTPSIASHHPPIKIQIKDSSYNLCQPQYLISLAEQRGHQATINCLLSQHLLWPINSPYNTPILSIKNLDSTYWLVQDLCLINQAVLSIHLVVPNLCSVLSLIPSHTTHFTFLDLNDAFFTISLHPYWLVLFAFIWTNLDTHIYFYHRAFKIVSHSIARISLSTALGESIKKCSSLLPGFPYGSCFSKLMPPDV